MGLGADRHRGRGRLTRRGWRTAFATFSLVAIAGCSASANANDPLTSGSTLGGAPDVATTTSSTIALISGLPPTTIPATTTSSTSTSTTTTTIALPVPLEVNLKQDVGLIAANATAQEIQSAQAFIARCRSIWPAGNRSIAMSISHHGQFVAAWTVGTTNNGNPIDLTARFRIASMSKMLTSLAVMKLVEQGLIQLDVPYVEQYHTDDTPNDSRWARITVRELLSHTSALPGLRGSFFRSTVHDWHDVVKVAYDRDLLAYEPGTKFFYSNANFVMLGALVEQVMGISYDQAVHQLVLDSLGITTAEMLTTEQQPEGDPAYSVTAGRRYMESLGPAGGWVMTATDAAKLMSAYDPTVAPVINADTIALMRTWGGVDSDVPDHYQYGFGLMLVNAPGTYVGHTGTIESVRSFALLLPNGYSITVLTTSEKHVSNGTALMDYFRGEADALALLPDL